MPILYTVYLLCCQVFIVALPIGFVNAFPCSKNGSIEWHFDYKYPLHIQMSPRDKLILDLRTKQKSNFKLLEAVVDVPQRNDSYFLISKSSDGQVSIEDKHEIAKKAVLKVSSPQQKWNDRGAKVSLQLIDQSITNLHLEVKLIYTDTVDFLGNPLFLTFRSRREADCRNGTVPDGFDSFSGVRYFWHGDEAKYIFPRQWNVTTLFINGKSLSRGLESKQAHMRYLNYINNDFRNIMGPTKYQMVFNPKRKEFIFSDTMRFGSSVKTSSHYFLGAMAENSEGTEVFRYIYLKTLPHPVFKTNGTPPPCNRRQVNFTNFAFFRGVNLSVFHGNVSYPVSDAGVFHVPGDLVDSKSSVSGKLSFNISMTSDDGTIRQRMVSLSIEKYKVIRNSQKCILTPGRLCMIRASKELWIKGRCVGLKSMDTMPSDHKIILNYLSDEHVDLVLGQPEFSIQLSYSYEASVQQVTVEAFVVDNEGMKLDEINVKVFPRPNVYSDSHRQPCNQQRFRVTNIDKFKVGGLRLVVSFKTISIPVKESGLIPVPEVLIDSIFTGKKGSSHRFQVIIKFYERGMEKVLFSHPAYIEFPVVHMVKDGLKFDHLIGDKQHDIADVAELEVKYQMTDVKGECKTFHGGLSVENVHIIDGIVWTQISEKLLVNIPKMDENSGGEIYALSSDRGQTYNRILHNSPRMVVLRMLPKRRFTKKQSVILKVFKMNTNGTMTFGLLNMTLYPDANFSCCCHERVGKCTLFNGNQLESLSIFTSEKRIKIMSKDFMFEVPKCVREKTITISISNTKFNSYAVHACPESEGGHPNGSTNYSKAVGVVFSILGIAVILSSSLCGGN